MALFIVSNLDDSGTGSLRQAIADSNTAIGHDEIRFDVSGRIVLTSGQLQITDTLTIDGDTDGDERADIIIDAQGRSRVILTSADTRLDSLTVANGRSQVDDRSGGGIKSTEGVITIVNSTLDNNKTYFTRISYSGLGGGVSAEDLVLVNSTVTGNAGAVGGGISADNLTAINSTITGNYAYAGGGGIFASGYAFLSGTTVADNYEIVDNPDSDDLLSGSNSSLRLDNSILEDVGYLGDSPTPISAAHSFLGASFILTEDRGGNIVGGTLALAVLADNGGSVFTRLPTEGSDLIGTGDPALLPPDIVDLDNDGDTLEPMILAANDVLRSESSLEIGAAEIDPFPNVGALIVDTLVDEIDGDYSAGDLSLREALYIASIRVGEDDITIAHAGTIRTGMGSLVIDSDVTIDGDVDGDGLGDIVIEGAGVQATGAAEESHVFEVTSGSSTIRGLTISRGSDADGAPSLSNPGGGVRVAVDAVLTIQDSHITDQDSDDGAGGIDNLGTLTVERSSISGNKGFFAGGVENSGTLTMINSSVTGNRGGLAGGINNSGVATIVHTTITRNDATYAYSFGDTVESGVGGIYNTGSQPLTLVNSIVLGNSAYLPENREIGALLPYLDAGINASGSIYGSNNERSSRVFATNPNGTLVLERIGDVEIPILQVASSNPAIDIGETVSDLDTDARGAARVTDFPLYGSGFLADAGALEVFPGLSRTGTSAGESLNGGVGNDTLMGLDGNDILRGLEGVDHLFGGDGNDILIGGAGADRFDGGDGIDTAYFFTAQSAVEVDMTDPSTNRGIAAGDTFADVENLVGSSFGDQLRGNELDNRISARDGDDTMSGFDGDDILVGGGGNDAMTGGLGADALFGGAGGDRARYADATAGQTADLGNASFNLGSFALGDTFSQIEELSGSAFDDDLRGDGRDNQLYGLDGSDRLSGRNGADTLRGGNGDDILRGGNGADRLVGGNGTDRADYLDAVSGVKADLQISQFNGGIAAGDRYFSIENLRGGREKDDLRGDAGDNVLDGLEGNDRLTGRRGEDELRGGAGDDFLNGGRGRDLLVGSTGADRFHFSDYANGFDTILDFEVGLDLIQLDSSVFTSVGPGALSADNLRFAGETPDADDYFVYANGSLYYDADANGTMAALTRFAIVTNAPALDADSFFIV